MTSTVHQIAWQKSSFSGNGPGNDCIEVAVADETIYLRESDDPDTVISTHPARLQQLIRRLKAGDFDLH